MYTSIGLAVFAAYFLAVLVTIGWHNSGSVIPRKSIANHRVVRDLNWLERFLDEHATVLLAALVALLLTALVLDSQLPLTERLIFVVLSGAVLGVAIANHPFRTGRLHRLQLPHKETAIRSELLDAVRKLGWVIRTDTPEYLEAKSRDSWWRPRYTLVAIYANGGLLLNCSPGGAFSSARSQVARIAEALQQQGRAT